MTLSRQHLLMSVALAVPAAAVVLIAVNSLQSREKLALAERIVQGHVVDTMRDACEQDPGWFLAGPRLPRPSLADRNMIDADVHLPRPSKEQLPFEIFAYDEQYTPSSVAGPRFPSRCATRCAARRRSSWCRKRSPATSAKACKPPC